MKKMYKLIAAGLICVASANVGAQNMVPFFDSVNYIGAFPNTDNTFATDWTSYWTEFDPENKVYPSVTNTVSADITTNTTWTADKVYKLVGNVAVKNGATLTIEPGTIIRGDKTTKACLIITKGSKIYAQGTAAKPIVFTSNEEPDVNGRSSGDWGGVIILGKGIINTPGTNVSCTGCGTGPNVNQIEGFESYDAVQLYGGSDNADSSGVFSFVRIEFAGVALSSTANSEINGLTLGGIGSKTKINHVQVSFSGDDAIEWFGGAVNAKYLIAYRTLDDDFDTDYAFSGNVQYGLIVRDPDIADQSKSEAFESDNYNPGLGRTPITNATFSNITIVGPTRDGSTVPGSNLFLCGVQIRRNSALSLFNSIITGWPKGLQVSGSSTQDNYSASSLDSAAYFNNNWIIGATNAVDVSVSSNTFYNSIFATNDSTKTNANVSWVNAFPANLTSTPDFRLNANSLADSVASFTNAKLKVKVPSYLLEYPVVTGINTVENNIVSVNIFPNPASDQINVSVNTNDIVNATIYNTTGMLVANYRNINNKIIDTSVLQNGIYLVNLNTNQGFNKTLRLVVSK